MRYQGYQVYQEKVRKRKAVKSLLGVCVWYGKYRVVKRTGTGGVLFSFMLHV